MVDHKKAVPESLKLCPLAVWWLANTMKKS